MEVGCLGVKSRDWREILSHSEKPGAVRPD